MNAEELARARAIFLGLPEATEQEAWGAPTFRVRKRLFAMIVDGHHAEGRTAVWLPAPVGAQRYLVDTEPERFFVPPYVGPRGWIGVCLDACDDAELRSLAVQAYCMVAPKKLQARVEER